MDTGGGSAVDGLVETATGQAEVIYAGDRVTRTRRKHRYRGGSASPEIPFSGVRGNRSTAELLADQLMGQEMFAHRAQAHSAVTVAQHPYPAITAGSQPGGGGGATQTGTQSGKGGDGEVWFWESYDRRAA